MQIHELDRLFECLRVVHDAQCINVGPLFAHYLFNGATRLRLWEHTVDLMSSSPPRFDCLGLLSMALIDGDDALIRQVTSNCPTPLPLGRLEVVISHGSGAILRTLLEAVGPQLEYLVLDDQVEPLGPEVVRAIFQRATRLRVLSLENVTLESMEVFLTAPLSSSLESLTLCNLALGDESSFGRFMRALASINCALSHSLVELSITRWGDPIDIWEQFAMMKSDLSSVEQMLDVNQKLRVLQLAVAEDVDASCLQELLSRHHGSRIPVVHTPLETAAKLAFLSVVQSATTSDGGAAVTALTTDLVREIFQFAAAPSERLLDFVTLDDFQERPNQHIHQWTIDDSDSGNDASYGGLFSRGNEEAFDQAWDDSRVFRRLELRW